MTKTPNAVAISDVRQIRALASGTRQEIVDALESAGPCSVRELADLIGRPADALYYHLKVLRRVGLVIDVQVDEGTSEQMVDVVARPLFLRYAPNSRINRENVSAVVTALTRSADRRFRRAFESRGVSVEGPARELWAGRCQGWVSDRDLAEVNALLAKALSILRNRQNPPSVGGRRCELTFVFAPLGTTRRAR